MRTNGGYVTVFVSLLISAILLIALAVIGISEMSSAKTKSVCALDSAMSSELAGYNRYAFDRYHLLMIDSTYSGRGQAAMEQHMSDALSYNLGDSFKVEAMEIASVVGIMDDDMAEFKYQVEENTLYQAAETIVDKIVEKTREDDTDTVVSDMDADVEARQAEIEDADSSSSDDESSETDTGEEGTEATDDTDTVSDPREDLKEAISGGIENLILPEDAPIGDNALSPDDISSYGRGAEEQASVNTDFSDYESLKSDLYTERGWGDSLVRNAKAIAYATECFNCLTDQKTDDTYLHLELEYLIAGKETDGQNYKRVIDEITAIRFALNFAYIVTDTAKMAELGAVAAALTVAVPYLEPVVKYLLAGCWSYIEAIADCYMLVRGKTIPYFKSAGTWITDLESLSHLDSLTCEETSEGLDYREYLVLLLAFHTDDIYYRMADLIEMNIRTNSDESFRVKNAITVFAVNVSIAYKGKEFAFYKEAGY